MKYNQLGDTDLTVSEICLGTMTWGEQNNEKQAHEQLDFAFERGVNFIDTAEMYPVPPRESTYGKTEQAIGKWGKIKNQRDEIVLASKIAGPGEMVRYIRGGSRLTLAHIRKAVEESLRRLQTDYIDLYQLHWPDRHTNYFGQLGYMPNSNEIVTPILETLEALQKMKSEGKIRHIGVSNETPWGVMTFKYLAETRGLPKIVSIQNPYSLLNRTFEIGLSEISHREKIGLLAYSPLGFGVLTGKYLESMPANARITLFPRFSRYMSDGGIEATKKYVDLARTYELSPAQMALAYVNSRPFLTSNIIGATNLEQLKENIESVNIKLNDEVLAKIEEIHLENSNPCP
ncbi:MAG: NADP(H)-dependent aldo-keto reductase [Halobacteriovoraceae bacterium]|nr:NADP(H)-dependent aldo-keto reductase [Halobacteriovoraceae bacterium]